MESSRGNFNAYTPQHECLYCTHLGRVNAMLIEPNGKRRYNAWCTLNPHWNGQGQYGCAYFQREPGTDDDVQP